MAKKKKPNQYQAGLFDEQPADAAAPAAHVETPITEPVTEPTRQQDEEPTLDQFLAALFGDEASDEPIKYDFVYTRDMAIFDGVLHDVSDVAASAGIFMPTCITDTIYRRIETHAFMNAGEYGDDPLLAQLPAATTRASVGALLNVAYQNISQTAATNPDTDRCTFPILLPHLVMDGPAGMRPRKFWERATCIAAMGYPSPWDHTPCLTVMLPEDD